MPRIPRPHSREPRELPDGRREYQWHLGRRAVAIGLGVLAAVILLIVVTPGGDGGALPSRHRLPPPSRVNSTGSTARSRPCPKYAGLTAVTRAADSGRLEAETARTLTAALT